MYFAVNNINDQKKGENPVYIAKKILIINLLLLLLAVPTQSHAQKIEEKANLLAIQLDPCLGKDAVYNFYTIDLGGLPPNLTEAYVRVINNRSVSYGDVASAYSPGNPPAYTNFKHFGQQNGYGMVNLNITGPNEYFQVASANDSGNIVGTKGAFPSNGTPDQPSYFDGTTLTTLTYASTGTYYIFPMSINNKNQIVGSATGTARVALYWPNKDSSAIWLASDGFAVDINDEEQIIINKNNAGYITKPTPPQPLTLLPHLSSANTSTTVAINSRGVIIGTSNKTSQPNQRPVFWKPVNGAYPAVTEINLVPAQNGYAYGINNRNDAILKYGVTNYIYNIGTGRSIQLNNPNSFDNFYPVSINDKCEVVGYSYNSTGIRSFKYIPL